MPGDEGPHSKDSLMIWKKKNRRQCSTIPYRNWRPNLVGEGRAANENTSTSPAEKERK